MDDDDYLDHQQVLLRLVTEAIYDTRDIVGTDVSKTQAAIFAHAALNAVRNSGFRIEPQDDMMVSKQQRE